MCQVNGFRSFRSPAFSTSTKLTDNTFTGCSTLCKKRSGCKTFSIQIGNGGSCRLCRAALVNDFTPDSNNLNIYWDVNCQRAVANSVSKALRCSPSNL